MGLLLLALAALLAPRALARDLQGAKGCTVAECRRYMQAIAEVRAQYPDSNFNRGGALYFPSCGAVCSKRHEQTADCLRVCDAAVAPPLLGQPSAIEKSVGEFCAKYGADSQTEQGYCNVKYPGRVSQYGGDDRLGGPALRGKDICKC